MNMDIIKIELFCILVLECFHTTVPFLLSDSQSGLDRCPPTVPHGKYVHSFRDRCYEFVTYTEKYWTDARHDCQHKGGELVVVDDAEIQTFITSILIALGNEKNGIWIGLTDSRHELHWEWVNGEPLQGYNNWAHGQGGANALHFTQDCAQIRMNDHGRWHDKECHLWPQKFSYVCQYDMLPEPSTSTMSTLPTSTVSVPTSTASSSSSSSSPSSSSTTTTRDVTTTSRQTYETDSLAASQAVSTSPWQPTTMSRSLSTVTESSETSTGISKDQGTSLTDATKTAASVTGKGSSRLFTTLMPLRLVQTSTHERVSSYQTKTIPGNMVTTKEQSVVCSEVDCSMSCPHGYAGIYVDLNGCINCRCN